MMTTNDEGIGFATVYSGGKETPVPEESRTPWMKNTDSTVEYGDYEEFFTLGGENMGLDDMDEGFVVPENRKLTVWQGDVEVKAFANAGEEEYAYMIEIGRVNFARWVFFPTLTDLFSFCNLLVPTLRLNYETLPLRMKGNDHKEMLARKNAEWRMRRDQLSKALCERRPCAGRGAVRGMGKCSIETTAQRRSTT